MKIKFCKIGPYPQDMFDMKMPRVRVVFENGKEEDLFKFFPDEIDFAEHEFIGLTRDEALRLRQTRDIAYLRS